MLKNTCLAILLSWFVLPLMAGERAYPIPQKIQKVNKHTMLLNGEWEFKRTEKSSWNVIQVPGEAVMQGYGIEHDKTFFYKKKINIPNSFDNQLVILRFDGVYSYAKLLVNGKFVREHKGGFTRWETDITSFVKVGAENTIELEIIDPLDEISYASGYAHHPVGGILRDVTLYALPKTHIYNMGVETDLDDAFKDATLNISFNAVDASKAEIEYILMDPKGKKVNLEKSVFHLNNGVNSNSIAVSNPQKWDAEHPNLYSLISVIKKEGKEVYRSQQSIGFREVLVVGDQLMVNGKPVKLRGACRHDIHPTLGRTTTAELDSLDAVLFKESNMNFVRTSHYPPTERFVEYCNRFGIYVEAETAVCFVDTYRQKNFAPGATHNDLAYTDQYLSQCREMVKTFRSHPSVIIWSIGNESQYGVNFQKSWDWVKAEDTTRPVIFSYPGAVNGDSKIYDILSMHYQDAYGNLSQWGKTTHNFQGHGIPALFDEWAHPACYTFETLRHDPNIREFWGISMDMMWSGLFKTRGGLGGGIWGYIDETFMVPQELKEGEPFWIEFSRSAPQKGFFGSTIGYGEWGIVDVWRRHKPEFWATKKAHSPIYLSDRGKNIGVFTPNVALTLPVFNRFDHTNLSETTVEYIYKGKKKRFNGLSLAAHQKGVLTIPAENWEKGEVIHLNFYDGRKNLIDAYQYHFGNENITLPKGQHKGNIKVEKTASHIVVKGDNFQIPFSKETGLIEKAVVNGKTIIEKGPFLNMWVNLNHLSGAEVRATANRIIVEEKDWVKTNFDIKEVKGGVLVNLKGSYKNIGLDLAINVSNDGRLDFNYRTENEPNGYLREIGLKFHLSNGFTDVKWKRNGYWNYYPEGDFAGNEGQSPLNSSKQALYGEMPKQAWHQDTHNYFYLGNKGSLSNNPLTQKAKGMKENIYYYSLLKDRNPLLSVISAQANVSCRMDRLEDDQLVLYIDNKWDYPEIAWGNYCKQLEASPAYGIISIIL